MRRINDCLAGCDPGTTRILRAGIEAALEAGKVIRGRYDKPHEIRLKGAIDLVTEADVASEKVILSVLKRLVPGVKVLAEESSSDYREIPAGPVWIIDPLDGTTNFAHGFPYFCVSIAYSIDRASQAGIVYNPLSDELFSAFKGGGARLNGRRISVSDQGSMAECLVATGFPYDIEENLSKVIGQVNRILPKVRDLRRAGAAALDLANVACGRLDGFWEMGLKPWDTAAGQLLVEEAGGRVTDFADDPWDPYFGEVLATNGLIHDELARLVNG